MVIHILANGQRVDDIKDHVVEINDKTVHAYELLVKKGAPNESNKKIKT